jgi:hypothetical protein
MRPINIHSWKVTPVLLAITWTVSALGASNTPPAKGAKTDSNRSEFVMPSSPADGRDPFFTDSNRPYEAAMAGTKSKDEISLLIFKGLSGTPDNRLAIINNHTFAVGDDEYVLTSQGRVHIHCLEILDHSVIVEVSGQRHELSFSGNK